MKLTQPAAVPKLRPSSAQPVPIKLGNSPANLIKSTKVLMATPQGRHLGTTHPSKSRTQNLCILDLRLRRALPSRRAHRRRRTAAATITVQAAARGALAPAPSAVNVRSRIVISYRRRRRAWWAKSTDRHVIAGGGERDGRQGGASGGLAAKRDDETGRQHSRFNVSPLTQT